MTSLLFVDSMSSCSDNEGTRPGIYDDVVTFEASANPAATRVTGVTWDAGDAIGIYMVGDETADNKQYTTSGGTSASFSPANLGTDGIKFPETGTADFYAYYPYTTSSANLEVPVDISNQNNDLDIMYAASLNVPDADTPVALTFDRKMTKLTFNLVDEAGIGMTGMTATLKGLNTTATLDLTDGSIKNAGMVADITAVTESATTSSATITAIVIPTTSTSGFSVNFKNSNVDVDYDFPDGTNLDAANNYSYKVTFTAEGQISVSSSINDWIDNNGGNIDINVGEGDGGSDPGPSPGTGDYYSTGTLASWDFSALGGTNLSNQSFPITQTSPSSLVSSAEISLVGSSNGTYGYTASSSSIYFGGWNESTPSGTYLLFTLPLDKEIQAGNKIEISYNTFGTQYAPKNVSIEISSDYNSDWSKIGSYEITETSASGQRESHTYNVTSDISTSDLYIRLVPVDDTSINGGKVQSGGNMRLINVNIELQ